MSTPQIPAFTKIPSRGSAPDAFSNDTDLFLSELVAFQTNANLAVDFVNLTAIDVADDGVAAAQAAATSVAARDVALGAQVASTDARDVTLIARDASITARDAAQAARDAAVPAASTAVAARDTAEAWADSPNEVTPGRHSAKYWADVAADSVSGGVIDDSLTAANKTWSSLRVSAEVGLSAGGTLIYTNGVLTGATEVLTGGTRTTALTYTPEGALATAAQTYAGRVRTTTLAYTGGALTGYTTTEVDE